ncbi:hypothetical protein H1R20_g7985, partial [Candolleomyces eurysporus]
MTSPAPRKTTLPQAPPVAGPSKSTRPLAVPPRAAPDARPPQDPTQMEGLYCLPTPVSTKLNSHPFGVVPGWVPQFPTFLVESWACEVAVSVPKPPHGATRRPKKAVNSQPSSGPEEESPIPQKPIVKKKFGNKEKSKQPLSWLHPSNAPLPSHLPGQETSIDNLGNQLPCPNLFQEYLLPDEQRSFSVSARPKFVLAPSHLLPPFSLKPRSDIKQKQKSDSYPKMKPP